MDKDQEIKQAYEGMVASLGVPLTVVPLIIELSKFMNDNHEVALFPEVRAEIADRLNIGPSRLTQLLKIMERGGLISPGKKIKLMYQLNECITPYERLIEKDRIRYNVDFAPDKIIAKFD